MSLDAFRRRIERFEAQGDGPPRGVLAVPEPVDRTLWPLAVLISQVEAMKCHTVLQQCEVCLYPLLPETMCTACGIERVPEPKRAFTWPKSGTCRVPWRWCESDFLKATQKAWCLSRGISGACMVCRYALAVDQLACLVCFNESLSKSLAVLHPER